tara:strand:+ start:402 stop:878 length:477 start_codon:yes stop_codon:yes gene_type:complete
MSFTKDKESDNYSTDKISWELIKDFIPKDKIIWCPFYSDGKQKIYFKEMGLDIIHDDKDFFNYTPKYDILIDNPPFSKLREILNKLKKLDKPFILIMPTSKLNALWVQRMFKKHLQLIIPKKQKLFFTHIDPKIIYTCGWGTYYYCYKMNLKKDLNFL